jgi:uncharacterized protein (DUF58 family)
VTRALAAAVLGLLLALAAAAFDSPSLYVPGVALLLLGAGSAIWVGLAASGARIERSLDLHSVEEEQPCPLHVSASSGVVPPPGGELAEPLLPAPVPVALRASRRVRVNVRFARRGRRELEPARLVIRDPLSLALREVATPAQQVLVLPRIEPVLSGKSADGAGSAAGLTGLLEQEGAELELDSLRPYREGAPASRIHWPTVARTGDMVERRLTADADSWPLVVLDPRHPADSDALDCAVRAAASLCVHIARLGGCALLLPGDRRPAEIDPALRSWPPLHARLAVVEPRDGAPAAAHLERAAAIFWVTAATSPALGPSLLRAASPRYLVTPVPRRGTPAGFTVAGCVAQRLGRRVARSAA